MLLLTLLSIIFFLGTLVASADTGNQEAIREVRQELQEKIALYIIAVAAERGVDGSLAWKVANCESGFKHDAVGDQGKSWGVWQIHLPAHPTVTIEFATDPIKSTEWAMDNLEEGRWGMWSCYRLIT